VITASHRLLFDMRDEVSDIWRKEQTNTVPSGAPVPLAAYA